VKSGKRSEKNKEADGRVTACPAKADKGKPGRLFVLDFYKT